MLIKLMVLDADATYLSRLQDHLATHYSGKVELLAFTDQAAASSALADKGADVFLASERFDIDPDSIPRRCGFGYLVDSGKIEAVHGVPAISKYTRVDHLYRQIIDLFDGVSDTVKYRRPNLASQTQVITFSSPAGGTGTTSVAVAFARTLAMQNDPRQVLYLSLDSTADTSLTFGLGASDHGTFSDVIYAVKRKRGNLQLQLDAHVNRDNYGTYFFATAAQATDVLEFSDEDLVFLIDHLLSSGTYDVIVVDAPFHLNGATIDLYERSSRIVLVSDGKVAANAKVARGATMLAQLDDQNSRGLFARTGILYNRFSSTKSSRITDIRLPELGGINRYEGASEPQVVDAIYAGGHLHGLVVEVLG